MTDADPPLPLADHTWRRVLGRCPLCGREDLREGMSIRALWCFGCRKRITKLELDELEKRKADCVVGSNDLEARDPNLEAMDGVGGLKT